MPISCSFAKFRSTQKKKSPKKAFFDMINPFVCGSFSPEVEEDHEPSSPCFSPRKNKKTSMNRSNGGNNKNKNPYALGGLDKFNMLLAELEEKRQQIYSQKGSDDISLVRFVYPDSNDCVPIVVKLKDKDKHKQNKSRDNIKDKPVEKSVDKFPVNSLASATESNESAKDQQKTKKKFSWDMEINRWRRPAYYLPAIVILILLFMAVFGRSVAVLCTSIGWYMVPSIQGGNSNPRKSMKKKKVYERRFSELKVSNNNKSGDGKDKAPGKHGHQKSW